jgi:MFS family permease
MTSRGLNARESWLGPAVAGIGTASLLADAGHEIPTALLPSLLTSTLGAPASALGVIEGVSDALAGAARFGGGALADDPHRRQTVAVGGYTTTAVLSAGIGAASTPWQAAVLRAGAWTARGLRVPARNALLADVVPPTLYGRAYGFERAMDNLGAIVGPLLAIGLVGAVGVRWAIGLSVIPGLLAAVAILYAIRHTTTPTVREHRPIRLQVRPVLQGRLGRLMAGVAAFEVGNCAATLLILRATELFDPGRSHDQAVQLAVGLYVVYNLAATLISVPAGHYADRQDTVHVLIAGAALFAGAYLWFAVGPSGVIVLTPAFVLAGLAIGCAETAEHTAVAELAPEMIRGSSFGLLAAIQSIGNLAASSLAGILWTAVSPSAAFVFLATAMVLAVAVLGTGGTHSGPLGSQQGSPTVA